MKPTKKKYRIELGLNLHAASVPQVNENMRIFPLQNALLDITDGDGEHAKPAWYSCFRIDDEVSFRLVDISRPRLPSQEPGYPKWVLADFYFRQPLTGQRSNPFTERVLEWHFSAQLDDQMSPAYSRSPEHVLPTWDMFGEGLDGEKLETFTMASFASLGDEDGEKGDGYRAFELTVVIKIRRDGWVNHYVFDPEMIVSETDNEGDQSGGGKGG